MIDLDPNRIRRRLEDAFLDSGKPFTADQVAELTFCTCRAIVASYPEFGARVISLFHNQATDRYELRLRMSFGAARRLGLTEDTDDAH